MNFPRTEPLHPWCCLISEVVVMMMAGRARATVESSFPFTLAFARTWPKRRLALVPEVSTMTRMGSAATWLAARREVRVSGEGSVETHRSGQRPRQGRAGMRDAYCKYCSGRKGETLLWLFFYTPQRSQTLHNYELRNWLCWVYYKVPV